MTGARATRRQRGAGIVEFALVLPIFLVLLLGAIDWGWYFTVRETAVNAVREGARAGSVAPPGFESANATTAVQNYLQSSLGSSYVQLPTVSLAGTVAGKPSVSVSLTDYPVVAGRAGSSITGLVAWTKVPTTLTVNAVMARQ